MLIKLVHTFFVFILLVQQASPQSSVHEPQGGSSQKGGLAFTNTYCNPLNIDYGYTPIPNFAEWGKHRATADPVIVLYSTLR